MAVVLVQASVTVTFPAVLRHVPRAGFQDGLPYYDCQSSGYFKGGAWTFVGVDIPIVNLSFSRAKLLDLL